MAVEFSAQEARNILSGLERECPELQVLDHSHSVFMTRNEESRMFELYGVENTEQNEPLYVLRAKDKEEYAFVNRYYMLRGGGEGRASAGNPPGVE